MTTEQIEVRVSDDVCAALDEIAQVVGITREQTASVIATLGVTRYIADREKINDTPPRSAGNGGEQTRPSSAGGLSPSDHVATLRDLLTCCSTWEPAVRVLGNVRAAPAIPDGCVIAPREPTEAMTTAGKHYLKGSESHTAERVLAIGVWSAMLAAAPTVNPSEIDSKLMEAIVGAGNRLVEAMVMQEMRESGELHIAQPSAKAIWDEAKRSWSDSVAAMKGGE